MMRDSSAALRLKRVRCDHRVVVTLTRRVYRCKAVKGTDEWNPADQGAARASTKFAFRFTNCRPSRHGAPT
eukprot:6069122-Prymnesium_polylepis.2